MGIDRSAGTFVLGVGAQKCGTTWFHSYLSLFNNFAAGFAKEYHVWDALDLPLMRRFVAARPGFFAALRYPSTKLRYRMQHEDGFYFEYFRSLLRDGVNLTADITPAYCGLSADRLAKIKAGFENLGVRCKVVFFVRDPVARDKSAVQFQLDQQIPEEGITPGTRDFCQALAQYYQTPHAAFRSSYHHTLQRVEQSFAADEVYVGVYENMFEPEAVRALSAFLGLQPRYEFASIKVNAGDRETVSCPEIERRIQAHYRDVYAYCNARLPATKELWPSDPLLH